MTAPDRETDRTRAVAGWPVPAAPAGGLHVSLAAGWAEPPGSFVFFPAITALVHGPLAPVARGGEEALGDSSADIATQGRPTTGRDD